MAKSREGTARALTAQTLADEILNHDSERIFAIESEYELCRRFKISRVTVRLALGDLEAKGLIFRRHGKGTFAFGRAKRVQRPLGVLLRKPPTQRQWPTTELIRGFQCGAAAMQADVLLLNASPQEWTTDEMNNLGGVLVIPSGMTREEFELLQNRKLPLLLGWECSLPGSRIDFGQIGSARVTTERLLISGHERIAFLGGFETTLDDLKKAGIREALESVGKCAKDLVEFVIPLEDDAAKETFSELVRCEPQFTAVITADDGIAARFAQFLGMRIPEAMSIASFHRNSFLALMQKPLSTVSFNFFEAGKMAADSLARAATTGEAPADVLVPGTFVDGATIGCRPVQILQASARSAS